MTDRATSWSVTINNPVESDYECIALARQKSGWRIDGEPETGKEGTPHLQLWCTTPQVRFSAMKKAFPRAHIEIARNITALKKYCAKDGTTLPSSDDKYPSMSKFWELLVDNEVPWESTEQMLSVDRKLRVLNRYDATVRVLIEQGYHCESLAMNPSTRSCWNNYSTSLRKRTQTERQDRQALLISQAVDIPTANADEKEALQEASSQASSVSQDESDEEFSESEYQEV